jgi:hypothetical protein
MAGTETTFLARGGEAAMTALACCLMAAGCKDVVDLAQITGRPGER